MQASFSLCGSCRSSFVAGARLQASSAPRVAPALGFSVEAAHKKGGGSTKNGRDSKSKRRGVKVYGGQPIQAGGIIVRQLGTKFHPGENVGLGNDYTLYATAPGIVVYKNSKYLNRVSVVPRSEYVVPEGQTVKEGSRKSRKKQLYQPRGLVAATASPAAAAPAL